MGKDDLSKKEKEDLINDIEYCINDLETVCEDFDRFAEKPSYVDDYSEVIEKGRSSVKRLREILL